MSRRPLWASLLALLTLAAIAPPAAAQGSADVSVRIREADLQRDGQTRLLVSVTGAAVDGVVLDGAAFEVTEDGSVIDGITVAPLRESDAGGVGIVLAVDVSGSTAGAPIAAARAAARTFAEAATASGSYVGVVSFGPTAELVTPLTTDGDVVGASIDELLADGETSLYDAVVVAAQALAEFDGLRNLIVFSDGADTVSSATLEEAVAAAAGAEVPVTTVALATEALDPGAIAALADGTGGRVIEAADTASLAGAFTVAAETIASQYVVTYEGEPAEGSDLDLGVRVEVGGTVAEDLVTLIDPREVPSAGPQPIAVADPGLLSDPRALWAGLAAAFLALLLIAVLITSTAHAEGENRRLQRSLHVYATGGTSRVRTRDFDASRLSKRAGDLIDHLPKPAGFDVALQRRIDQAAWPLRASELVAIRLAVAVGGAILAWAATASLLLPVVGLAAGWFLPRAILDHRVRKRSEAFLEQMPDTLGLLAGSLKAGYGLVQAIDTVVRESPSPTSEEYARALTETRLGMPLSEALEAMADRTDSEDFGWAVMAINIQSEVGGNLAQLLETVANTLREREQVRRQVRTLSAEGKLSAWVLIGLVPAMGLYMFSLNRSYIGLLWTTSMGRAMVAVGLALMLAGIVGIKKIISIDV